MFTLNEILKATGGTLLNGPEKGSVKSVSIDSRKVMPGELFIAVKGEIFDGHDFVADVVKKGVHVVIVHKPVKVDDPKASVILVKDTTRALGDIARFHRLRFKIPVIAITGSAGKTTTKEMIAVVLEKKFKVLKNEGTQNNHIGVPLTLLKLTKQHKIVVLECGTNQPGDIPWLSDVARPTVAAFTNIGESHLEKLKTPAGVLKEKWHLVDFLPKSGRIIINSDDKYLIKNAKKAKCPVVTCALKSKAKFQAVDIGYIEGRMLKFKVGGNQLTINSCGISNIYNALTAYACGSLFKVPVKSIIKAIGDFQFPPGRGQILPLGIGWLINDAYNANPVSMRSALQTLEAIDVKGQKIFIAADMLELGDKSEELHRSIGKAAAAARVNVLMTVGKFAKFIAQEARRRDKKMQVFACADVEDVQKYLGKVFRNGDAVLIKGSRRMAMERVTDFLLTAPKGARE